MIQTYYRLTKPGIVYGNAVVAASAFIFGSHTFIDWRLFSLMLLGLSLIIASACVFNNYWDRDIDAKMERTKNRAFAAGRVNHTHALVFGFVLLAGGVTLLLGTNILTLLLALLGFAVYVCMYTPLKSRTGYAVYVGAVAGAMPPVIGYTAATNTLDLYALAFFVFLFLWQLPHFFAIARYRYDDYKTAGVPLLVEQPHDERSRRGARATFYFSLALLLLFCLILILQR